MKNFFSNLPSWAWIFILAGGLVGFIGGIILLFWAIATVEGFVSIIFILIGISYVLGSRKVSNIITEARVNEGKSQNVPFANFFVAGGILFFALMGMALDQPGNYFYNKPIEYFYCPENSSLTRSIDVSHPLPGRTDVTQNFTCYGPDGDVAEVVSVLDVIWVRFVEYIFIGYFFYYLARFVRGRSMKVESSVITRKG